MTDMTAEQSGDRLIIHFDPSGPIEVGDLTSRLAALARLYERHYRPSGEPAPRLYITKLESGSFIAEIAPYLVLLGAPLAAMDGALIISDFTRRLSKGIRAFSDPGSDAGALGPSPSRSDAADIREFVRPLAGRKGANLGIKHARLVQEDGERRTLVEYAFDESEINRAAINIESILSEPDPPLLLEAPEVTSTNTLTEVMLFFEQASRKPGKESGKTGDRAIVPDVTDKSLPVYFRKSFQNLKDQMVKGDVNPLTDRAFIVDVHVQRLDGAPKGYVVTNVHDIIPLDTPPGS